MDLTKSAFESMLWNIAQVSVMVMAGWVLTW